MKAFDRLKRPLPDRFILALLAAIALATVWPVAGEAARYYTQFTHAAIALLFFLHGAKLSRDAIYAGASNWRLHLSLSLIHI